MDEYVKNMIKNTVSKMVDESPFVFEDGIPIPRANIEIYRKLYVLETNLRRIALSALMAVYGNKWIHSIDSEMPKGLKARNSGLLGRQYFDCENDDNLIWLTTFEEVLRILETDSLAAFINIAIGRDHKRIFLNRLREIREIRNIIGHNRATSNKTVEILNGILVGLDYAFKNFQKNVLFPFPTGAFIEDNYIEGDIIANCFNEQFTDIDMCLCQTDFFNYIYFDNSYPDSDDRNISIPLLLNKVRDYSHNILAFIPCIFDNSFLVLVSRKIDSESVIVMLESLYSGMPRTEKPYLKQNSIALCHPKIWFYRDYQFPYRFDES